MIVSHRHRFIFIKTRKTAGTSIEIVLSRYCGPDDILSANRAEDEQLRQEIGGVGPQNHMGPIYKHEPKDIARILLKRRPVRRPLYWKHMDSHQVRRLLGREIWDSYYKFAFERNPWDKVVSQYYWTHRNSLDAKGDPPISFGEFVRKGKKLINVDGYELYTIGGLVAVDHLGRYESLQSDLTQALDTIGIDYDGWMPSAKSATRKIRSYREFYGDQERELIAGYFHREIGLLGYEF